MFGLLMAFILSKTNIFEMFLGVIALATFSACMLEHSILPLFCVLGVCAALFGIYIGIAYLIKFAVLGICWLVGKIIDFFRK